MSTRNIESTEPDYGKIAFEAYWLHGPISPTPKWDNATPNGKEEWGRIATSVIQAYRERHKPEVTAEEMFFWENPTADEAYWQHSISESAKVSWKKRAETFNTYLRAKTASRSTPSTEQPRVTEALLVAALAAVGLTPHRDRVATMLEVLNGGSPKDVLAPTGENVPEGTDAGGQEWEEFEAGKTVVQEGDEIRFFGGVEWYPVQEVMLGRTTHSSCIRRPRRPASAAAPSERKEGETPQCDKLKNSLDPALWAELAHYLERQLTEAREQVKALERRVQAAEHINEGYRAMEQKLEETLRELSTLTQQRDEAVEERNIFEKALQGRAAEATRLTQQLAEKDAEIAHRRKEFERVRDDKWNVICENDKLKAQIADLSTPASPWRNAKSDPPKESDEDWNKNVFVLIGQSHAAAVLRGDLVKGYPRVVAWMPIPPPPTPAVEQDDGFEKWVKEEANRADDGEYHLTDHDKHMMKIAWDARAALTSRKEGQ